LTPPLTEMLVQQPNFLQKASQAGTYST